MGRNVLRNNLAVNLYAYVYRTRVSIGAMHDLDADLLKQAFRVLKVKLEFSHFLTFKQNRFGQSHVQMRLYYYYHLYL
jgi:hypothetical protein